MELGRWHLIAATGILIALGIAGAKSWGLGTALAIFTFVMMVLQNERLKWPSSTLSLLPLAIGSAVLFGVWLWKMVPSLYRAALTGKVVPPTCRDCPPADEVSFGQEPFLFLYGFLFLIFFGVLTANLLAGSVRRLSAKFRAPD